MSALLAVSALLAGATPAIALDLGDWVPGLKLTPFVSQKTTYETNIFQAPSDAKDDVILTTIPGFLAEYGGSRHSVTVGYRTEILRYLSLTNQDTENHFAVGQLRLEFPRLLVNIRDNFDKTNSPPNTELTGPVISATNTLVPTVEYRLTQRFSLGANFNWTRVDFERSDLAHDLNRDELLAGPTLYWKILPKSDLGLSYSYGEKQFDSATDRDVTRHVITVGIRGDLTAKLSSTFRGGYEIREATAGSHQGFSGLSLGGDWSYRPDERTRFMLITDRSLYESTFGSSPYFVSTVATLLAEHQFGPKLSVNARVTGGTNSYPTKETVGGRTKFREDTLYGWGAAAYYDIQRWLRVSLDYSTTRRSSNFNDFSFTDDRFTGTVTLQF